ncbi:hypothetical protein Pmar_PMAR004439 [Perkinsus marinus ATCC 50983]|uniref:Uncharacterized protein n=1 Tax=Perkinsus marinus (strain ATCC 50983 / TXsc) TaxID=423536 RepID=C5LZN4_PERM5|nr:hypothetical protein Pmar_PMAR004439 [Perkinsus marinus ATCC 50983]EEQ97702.1 hypothetical protein Pmar_PMAR004439 [Perkinsus marinus ATCC 50983]|eukprot:XP_002764985.1 hypothetical protein Pmar_PMAR004439 [Perkinsus marinus ATCC 50983]
MSSASIGHSGGFHMRVTNQSVVINGEVPAYNHPNEDGYGSKVSVKRYAHGLVIRASTQHDGVSRLMQRFYTLGGDCNLNKTRVEFDKTSGKLTITVPREGAKVDDRVVSSRHQKAIETAAAHAHEKNRIRVVFDDHGGSAHVFVPKTSGGILTLLGDKLTLEDGEVVHLPVVMDEAAKERYDSNDMLHYVLKTKDEPQELLPFSEEL